MQWLPLPHDLSPDNSILLSFCRPYKTHIAQEWLAESPVMNVTYTVFTTNPVPFSFSHYSWTASLGAESAPIHAVMNAVHKYFVLHNDCYDQSAAHSSSGSRLYERYVTSVPLSIKIYDSVVKVHGLVLALSPGQFPHTT